jgi:hypothetical protein
MEENLPRMRTVSQTIAELKALDSATAITAHYLRTLALTKSVNCFFTGKKALLDLDSVLRFLNRQGGHDNE